VQGDRPSTAAKRVPVSDNVAVTRDCLRPTELSQHNRTIVASRSDTLTRFGDIRLGEAAVRTEAGGCEV